MQKLSSRQHCHGLRKGISVPTDLWTKCRTDSSREYLHRMSHANHLPKVGDDEVMERGMLDTVPRCTSASQQYYDVYELGMQDSDRCRAFSSDRRPVSAAATTPEKGRLRIESMSKEDIDAISGTSNEACISATFGRTRTDLTPKTVVHPSVEPRVKKRRWHLERATESLMGFRAASTRSVDSLTLPALIRAKCIAMQSGRQ